VFERPAWLGQLESISSAFADHRSRIMEIAAQLDLATPKFDFRFVMPEWEAPLRLGAQALALAARLAPPTPDLASTWRLLDAGRTTLGMSTAGLLLTRPEEGWPDECLLEDQDELVSGPEEARVRLRAALGDLDPRLVQRLDGAWERVSRDGPDAASQAASSLVELIDWTLRRAGPEKDVLAWHAGAARSPSELDDGRPTRGLRVRFIVRERPDAAAADFYARAIGDVLRLLQGHKHGSGAQHLAALARLVPTVEAYLAFLLL